MEETWDQIGVQLKQARENAEMSVDDVVFRTRIPRAVVEALEAEDFSVFTSPTYAKSFLRQYSEFLKVDADPWLTALEPAAYVGGDGVQPMFAAGQTSPLAKRPAGAARRQEAEPAAGTGGKWAAVWVMLLTAALVVGVVKGYQIFDKKFGGEVSEKTESPSESKPEPKTPAATESGTPPESASVPETPATPEDPAKKDPSAPPAPRAIIVRD